MNVQSALAQSVQHSKGKQLGRTSNGTENPVALTGVSHALIGRHIKQSPLLMSSENLMNDLWVCRRRGCGGSEVYLATAARPSAAGRAVFHPILLSVVTKFPFLRTT